MVVSLLLPWSLFYQIEERQTTLGRVEPKSGGIAVKSKIEGKVAKILVSEGDKVKVGETLIELDSSRLQLILQQKWQGLEAGEKRLEQLQLFEQQLEVAMLDREQSKQQKILEQRFKIEEIKQELKILFQDYETQKLSHSNTVVINYQSSPIASSLDSQYQNQLLNIQRDIIETRSHLDQANKKYQFLVNSQKIELLNNQNIIQKNQEVILAVQIKNRQLKEQINRLDQQLNQYTFRSPTTGTVFNIAVSKIGDQIDSGISLLEIVPSNAPLIIRAQLREPIDIINLEGLSVNLRFTTHSKEENSRVKGKIVQVISPSTSDQKNLEIELLDKCIQLSDRCVSPSVGETAVVEIITGQRRAIEWLLKPFTSRQPLNYFSGNDTINQPHN
jgi:HlyD family secretion protein